MIGLLNQEQGRWAEAESYYRQALSVDEKDNSARKGLAMALIRQNKQDETVAVMKEILQREPGNQDALFNLGLLESRRGNLEAAGAAFEELVKLNAGHRDGHVQLGMV